jgi:NADP-dependent 3-hydroxy acid dehydrogenase YdfG
MLAQMAETLEGKVVLVTGASSGIGEATALRVARAGGRVVVAARRVERLDALVARVAREGGEALAVAADVAKEAEARSLVAQAHAKWGRLDVVDNSAGIMLLGAVDGAATSDWRRMIDVNLLGLMVVTHAALPLFRAAKSGHFVNVSSLAGRIANPGAAVYAATKFGVCAFSEALRREVYKDGIRVTVVEPGVVATELGEHITDAEAKAGLKARVAAMTPLEAEDIAAAVAYAIAQPPRVNVNEILVRPTAQER